MGSGDSISAYVWDDVPELRRLVRHALQEGGEVRVVGDAGDPETALREIGGLQPDVVVLDLSMPGMDGLEALVSPRPYGAGIWRFCGWTTFSSL